MLVGDAAHQIHTPHKTGILNSMDAGVLAGEVAVEAMKKEISLIIFYRDMKRDIIDYIMRTRSSDICSLSLLLYCQ
jgi:flavin-dependent dehydrogenase